jgi:hypothetical protein
MRKTWVLATDTKGTGAEMVPLEKAGKKERPRGPQVFDERKRSDGPNRREPAPARKVETSSTPLPPGHVRKKTTGEIGQVRSVDPKAGTATVFWLRAGRASTVPLSAVSRR